MFGRIFTKKGFSRFNLAVSWKRKYRGQQEDEPWYLLTNLPDLKSANKIYGQRCRNRRRHSKFWIGLYGENWLIASECCREWVESMMGLVRNKRAFYQRELKAIKLIEQPL
jgi:hypothetical protein